MRQVFRSLVKWMQAMDRNERFYLLGLIMMLIGFSYSLSLFVALAVVGSVMVVESVITSYMAGMINSRSK